LLQLAGKGVCHDAEVLGEVAVDVRGVADLVDKPNFAECLEVLSTQSRYKEGAGEVEQQTRRRGYGKERGAVAPGITAGKNRVRGWHSGQQMLPSNAALTP